MKGKIMKDEAMENFKNMVLERYFKVCCIDELSQRDERTKHIEARLATMFPTRIHTPDHPPYSEMITGAIRVLNERWGSYEASISDRIKSTYQDLPFAHPHFLKIHIEKLLQMGDIVSTTKAPQRYSLSKHVPNLINEPMQLKRKKRGSSQKSLNKSKLETVLTEEIPKRKRRKLSTDKEEQVSRYINDEDELIVPTKENPGDNVNKIQPLQVKAATKSPQEHDLGKGEEGKHSDVVLESNDQDEGLIETLPTRVLQPGAVLKYNEINLRCQKQPPKLRPRARVHSLIQLQQPRGEQAQRFSSKQKVSGQSPYSSYKPLEGKRKRQILLLESDEDEPSVTKCRRRALIIESDEDEPSTVAIKFDGVQLETVLSHKSERLPTQIIEGGSPDTLQKKEMLELANSTKKDDSYANHQLVILSLPVQSNHSQTEQGSRERGKNLIPSRKRLSIIHNERPLVEASKEDEQILSKDGELDLSLQVVDISPPLLPEQLQTECVTPGSGRGRGKKLVQKRGH